MQEREYLEKQLAGQNEELKAKALEHERRTAQWENIRLLERILTSCLGADVPTGGGLLQYPGQETHAKFRVKMTRYVIEQYLAELDRIDQLTPEEND